MIRELIADFKRYKQDRVTNNRIYKKVEGFEKGYLNLSNVKSSELRVGDIIMIENN